MYSHTERKIPFICKTSLCWLLCHCTSAGLVWSFGSFVYIFIRGAFSCCSTPEFIFKQKMNWGVIDATRSIGTEQGWSAGWWDVYIRAQRQKERDVAEGFFRVATTLIFHGAHYRRQRKEHLQTRCFVLCSIYRPQTLQTAGKCLCFTCCLCKQVLGRAQSINSL